MAGRSWAGCLLLVALLGVALEVDGALDGGSKLAPGYRIVFDRMLDEQRNDIALVELGQATWMQAFYTKPDVAYKSCKSFLKVSAVTRWTYLQFSYCCQLSHGRTPAASCWEWFGSPRALRRHCHSTALRSAARCLLTSPAPSLHRPPSILPYTVWQGGLPALH